MDTEATWPLDFYATSKSHKYYAFTLNLNHYFSLIWAHINSSHFIILYKIIWIVRMLWLVEKPLYIRICKYVFHPLFPHEVNSLFFYIIRFASWYSALISCSPTSRVFKSVYVNTETIYILNCVYFRKLQSDFHARRHFELWRVLVASLYPRWPAVNQWGCYNATKTRHNSRWHSREM